jgi:hypothetical protein
MKNPFDDHHIIFSAEGAMHPTKHQVVPSHEEVLDYLRSQGENAVGVQGHYGSPERSILVNSPKNPKGLHQLATDLGQDSILESKNGQHALTYLNGAQKGKVITGEGTTFHPLKPEDLYTTIKTPKGDVHFSHNLNFSQSAVNKSESGMGDLSTDEDTNDLMNREENKYFVSRDQLDLLTQTAKENLKEGDIDTESRYNTNRTFYMDNKDLDSMKDGLDGIKPRLKIRVRQYAPNHKDWENIAYVEIKAKKKDGMTNKCRVRIYADDIEPFLEGKPLENSKDLINLNKDITKKLLDKRILAVNNIVSTYGFKKQIEVRYERRAYTGKKVRITIDDNLKYLDATEISPENKEAIKNTDGWKRMDKHTDKLRRKDYLIVEVKHQGDAPRWVKDLLDKTDAKEVKFSKYCAAVASYIKSGKKENNISRLSFDFSDNLDKTESLTKMPKVFTGTPKKPHTTVYRMQDKHGEGPYMAGIPALDNHGSSSSARGLSTPDPKYDQGFNATDLKVLHDSPAVKFGFEKPEHAHEWFSPDEIEELGNHGFTLQPVKAAHVWSSGKQAFYKKYVKPKKP